MEILIIIGLFLVWWFIGMNGFIYYQLKTGDLKVSHLPSMMLLGLLGVMTWIVGALIYFEFKPKNDHTIFKRKIKH